MFVASGDSDAYPVGTLVSFPTGSPYVTVVGGTSLTNNGVGGSWIAESVWNVNNEGSCDNTPNRGSSGGISTNYTIPFWQSGVSMSLNGGSTNMRNLPDVAMTADNVFCTFMGTNWCLAGTSCAAPLWAGFAALVNQQRAANGEPPVGFLNPAIYAIGLGSHYTNDFHDITNGNNWNISSLTNFSAVLGYDLCTGWGTPAGSNLINDLAASGSCVIATTGNMTTNRQALTSTLLPNGLGLVAGGANDDSVALASAALYNPVTGTWTNTGTLNTARYLHTATLLPNGLVLVAGGVNGSGELASSELYYPETGRWTNTGSLHTARECHTATLLPNGLVLAAGGAESSGTIGGVMLGASPPPGGGGSSTTPLASAELYNPETG